ncbi:hypothetical protein NQ314_000302 [Rhamnusium bicolor]|uniref:DUF4806 domain-containing protein n=1 Tax=Rhamnusium bicolor TaxID=1586634 RepID=A0AAV8ZYQ5_9CUCU|nr:hypothetical protein NQ314_000302 [Rhamnusium bicolor]
MLEDNSHFVTAENLAINTTFELHSDNDIQTPNYLNKNNDVEDHRISQFPLNSYNPNMFMHLQNYDISKTETSQDKKIVLVEELQKWVSKNDVNSNHVTELLHILHPHLNFLPMQARTLMKTPRSSIFMDCHFFKSSSTELYPILALCNDLNDNRPFAVAVFCGDGKPNPTESYLKDFISEINELRSSGLTTLDEKKLQVDINFFICDAPARAYLKNILGHNSLHACEKCNILAFLKMFAIIEFMGEDDETGGEISIVPLSWLQKNDTKCYCPINTKRKSFSEFVKDKTPYKTSWPSYKIYKVHQKTASYSEAEEILEKLINASQAESSDSLISNRSLIRKVKDNLPIPARSDSSSDSEIDKVKKTHMSQDESKQNPLDSSDEENVDTGNKSSGINIPRTAATTTTNIRQPSKLIRGIDCISVELTSPSVTSISSGEIASLNLGYETIAENLASIKTILAQHSIILNQLQRHVQLTNVGALVPPANLPDFPIKTYEQFEEFENLLVSDRGLEIYMTNRLAAVGGTGIDSLTRRILKYVLSNEVGMLFNWKGRDKKCFEKTALMKIIYGEGL